MGHHCFQPFKNHLSSVLAESPGFLTEWLSCISKDCFHFNKLFFIQLYILSFIRHPQDLLYTLAYSSPLAGAALPQWGGLTEIIDLVGKRESGGTCSCGLYIILNEGDASL